MEMEKSNKQFLAIAGIINILEGALVCAYNEVAIVGFIIMAIGLYFMSTSNKTLEEMHKQRIALLVIAIINLSACLISSIFVFIVFDKLNNYRKSVNGINAPPEEEINPEVKKINLLLKLGVAMVFISGLLFATTSWDFITDTVKAIALIGFGAIFLGLSALTEKLKLENSSYVYWILGMMFFVLTVIGACFFEMFGPFLTFDGEGKYLTYFIIAIVIGVLSNITYFKYNKPYLMYIAYIGYLVATHNVIMQAKPSILFSLIILSVMNLITYLIDKKDKSLNEISNIFIYILSLLVCSNVISEELVTLKLLAMFISIINLLYLKLNDEDEMLSLLGILTTYVLVSTTIGSLSLALIPKLVIIFILISIYSIYNNLKENTILVTEINNIIYTLFSLVIYFICLEENMLVALLISFIYLAIGVSAKLKDKIFNRSRLFEMALPITIPIIIFPFAGLIGFAEDIKYAFGLSVSSALYCVGHYVLKNQTEKKRFLIYSIISTIFTLFISIEVEELMVSIFPVVTSLYIVGIFYNHKIKTYIILPYMLYLLCIFVPLGIIDIFNINIIFNTIIIIWMFIMSMIVLESDLIKKITEIAITVPLFNLLAKNNYDEVLVNIMVSILILYLTFIIIKYFIKEHKCLLSMIGIGLALISIIFQTNIYYALYIGVVGIIVMIIGYNYKNYEHLFKFGIGIIVLNIIVQLQTVWEKVPFYLYLLVFGLGIIGFVSYKELKKINKEKGE